MVELCVSKTGVPQKTSFLSFVYLRLASKLWLLQPVQAVLLLDKSSTTGTVQIKLDGNNLKGCLCDSDQSYHGPTTKIFTLM